MAAAQDLVDFFLHLVRLLARNDRLVEFLSSLLTECLLLKHVAALELHTEAKIKSKKVFFCECCVLAFPES